MTPAAPRRRVWTLGLGIALLALLIRAPLFDLPLERDEGGYAYIAWRLEHGELPYREWFDQKPPGIFLAYRLALAAPGDPVTAVRGLAALSSAGAALALFALARRLLDARAAALAAILLAWLSADPFLQGPIANTELFMLPWLVLANLAFLAAARGEARLVPAALGAGAALGLALCFKQVAAVDALLFAALFPMLARGPRPVRRAFGFAAGAALGGLAVWLPVLAWFHARGGVPALLEAVFLHNLAYASGLSLAERLAGLRVSGAALWASAGGAFALAAVGLLALARGAERWRALYLGGWLVAGFLGVSASGYYFVHYFQQLLPPLAVAAAAGAQALHRHPGWGHVPGALRAAALAAIALAAPVAHAVELWRLTPAAAMQRMYPGNPFEAMPQLAEEVAALTTPHDSVFVYGAEPEILFDARRRSASRYIYLFPLFGRYADAGERQRHVIEEIRRAEPAVIVAVPNALFAMPGARQDLTRWLVDYTAAHYRPHAHLVSEPGGRGRMLRSGDPGFDGEAAKRAFAHVFVRR